MFKYIIYNYGSYTLLPYEKEINGIKIANDITKTLIILINEKVLQFHRKRSKKISIYCETAHKSHSQKQTNGKTAVPSTVEKAHKNI